MDNRGFINEDGAECNGDKKTENGTANDKTNKAFSSELEPASKNSNKDKTLSIEDVVEEKDPWKVTSVSVNYTPWTELTRKERIHRVVSYFIKTILVLACLYMFICSLDFLSSAFRLLGGETAGKVFQQSDIMKNPVAGVMIGVLVTVLVQSSSTSTSVIVSMVGAGILDIKTAIPIIMGANIGTSVTNTIVAMGQMGDKDQFRRAFAGATVHDMFNWLTVIILLPVEVITDYLYYLTEAIVNSLPLKQDVDADKDMLKVITTPFTDKIIQVSKDAMTKIALGKEDMFDQDTAIMKLCCDKTSPTDCCKDSLKNKQTFDFIKTGVNYTSQQKLFVCSQIKGCMKESTTQHIEHCQTIPWFYTEQKTKSIIEKLACETFTGTESETHCCQSKLDLTADRNNTGRCQDISSCFNSDGHSFTNAACMMAWTNVTEEKTVWGEVLSCAKWARDVGNYTCDNDCDFLFRGLYPALNEKAIGGILLVISLTILCICLICIVKLLHSLLQGPMAMIIKKFINADFPGCCGYFTGYLAVLIGAGMTIIVQSSSIFTSTLTPLVGIGVIELERMYPLTLGSNIGTTTTAILSALATSSDNMKNALQVAFCHLFFNISGILIFYPIPALRFPLPMARFLGNCTARYRWYAIIYILLMFFLFPALVFALSIPGWYVLLAVLGPFVILLFAVGIIRYLQVKRPKLLPAKLQNWTFLPLALRSLEPYDRGMQKIFFCKRFQNPRQVIGAGRSSIKITSTQEASSLPVMNTRL